jgi:hypothetical protein
MLSAELHFQGPIHVLVGNNSRIHCDLLAERETCCSPPQLPALSADTPQLFLQRLRMMLRKGQQPAGELTIRRNQSKLQSSKDGLDT